MDGMTISAIAIVALALIAAGSILSAVLEKASFKSIKPNPAVSINDAIMREKDFRSILMPGYIAVGAGLFVSLAASYLFAGMTQSDRLLQGIGVAIFFGALVPATFGLYSIVRTPASTSNIAKSPQLIALAARSISAEAHDAPQQLKALEKAHERWSDNEVTIALGLRPLDDPTSINQLWSRIDGDLNMCFSKAEEHRTREIRKSAIQAMPWTRFALPGAALLSLLVSALGSVLEWSIEGLVVFILASILFAISLLALRIYHSRWVSSGIRRFAINKQFCEESTVALHDCAYRLRTAGQHTGSPHAPVYVQVEQSRARSSFLSGLAVGSIVASAATIAQRLRRD